MHKYTREELDALMEIRSRLKQELGVKLMLSNAELYKELEAFWYLSPDAVTKSKIRGFLREKGVSWDDPLA